MLLCCLLHFLTCVILVSNKMKVLLTSTHNVTNRGLETAVSFHCISPVLSLRGKMFFNQIQGSNRSEDGGPRRQLSTSETSKKLNQSEFLERSVRIMKLSLSFDPYHWFCGILSQYLNAAARWACFQGFRKWLLSHLRSFFWYCSLHIHFYNFHFRRAFDIFQGEMDVGPSSGGVLQIGILGDIGDSETGLDTPVFLTQPALLRHFTGPEKCVKVIISAL